MYKMSEWFIFENFIFLTGEALKEVVFKFRIIFCGYRNLREVKLSKNQFFRLSNYSFVRFQKA